ncbi:MAG: DUF2129 domain-containing protein [Bacillota bacterium]
MQERVSLIVYYKSPKALKQIQQQGNVTYYHKKRHYAVLYVDAADVEKTIKLFKSLRHIRYVEISQLDQSAYILENENQVDKIQTKETNESEDVK